MKSRLAQLIQKARKKTGLTQEELALQLNYHKQFISNWESGSSHPPIRCFSALAKALRVKTIDLIEARLKDLKAQWLKEIKTN